MPAITRRAATESPTLVTFETPLVSKPSHRVQSTPTATPQSAPRPLCPAKVVAGPGPSSSSSRRFRVVFSPQLAHTKLFRSSDPLLPEVLSGGIREPSSSGLDSPSSSRRSVSPSVRGILKRAPTGIRLAKSTQEGTWNNREPARLIVAGRKPRFFYSTMVLAELCDGAEDGVAGRIPSDDDPESDDLAGVDAPEGFPNAPGSDASEEEEEVECLHPSSLVSVILEGAEDLLTLEEAYTSLNLRLREVMFNIGPATEATQARFDAVWQPISEEAPAVVRAIQRDLHRLMGKVPNSEAESTSSPFRGLMPAGLPPSPAKSPRKGYTAAEVLYRRESAGVGGAVLRLLAIVFSHPRLFACFTEADILSLLDQVLVITRSPTLPTPFAKRTYTMTMTILAQLNLPPTWLRPFEKKLASALECGLNTIGVGQFPIKDPSAIRKEAYNATANLLKKYPDIMFPHYPSLLNTSLRTLSHPSKLIRRCSVAVAATFVSAKLQLLEDADIVGGYDKFESNKIRSLVAKSEIFVANFLKSPIKVSGKMVYDKNTTEKRTEGGVLGITFRSTIGETKDVAWACTTWAVLASLMGHTYNTSSQSQEIDHIMNRCLQSSTNTVRPTLATAAWLHAVYAYLHAGASVSFSDNGSIVRSYNPFVASSYQDVAGRLSTIMMPVRFALEAASATSNVTLSLGPRPEFNNEQRWNWQRSEKPKRAAWLVTSGLVSASIIYAYSVVALAHEEASAAERSRMSGLPSSDGVIPDLSPEERRLPRLDRTFEMVLHPILTQLFSINGVDALKTNGWEILAAITASSSGRAPSLDRLINHRFLNAEIVGVEEVPPHVLARFERDRIAPSEIPAWGKLWVAKRLGKLLALFEDAFLGVRGIGELAAVQWVTNSDGLVLLPEVLSRVWSNLLRALAITNTAEAPTPLYVFGLRAVTRTLLRIYDSDPSKYVPVCLVNAENKSALNPDAVRLGITLHLYNVAVEVMGENALGGIRVDLKVQGVEEPAFAAEPFGHPTVAGLILGHVLRGDHLTTPTEAKVQPLLVSFISALLDSGCSGDLGTRLLGDLTNAMPWVFDSHEQLQLNVWRLVALKWASVIDLEPSESSATNHTGSLLVSLLSGPFRSSDSASRWYNDAAQEDIDAWNSLLEVTVLRFRAKRAGSNFGVMETLAAHLEDFIRVESDEETRKRRGSGTTLGCLASATNWISIVQTEHYHADHYTINENYVPADFLAFVASALIDAYGPEPSPKVFDLVNNVAALFDDLPPTAFVHVLEPLRPGLVKWMTDEDRHASGELGDAIDKLYVVLIDALARAIESSAVPASAEAMDEFIDIYAPRLSRAQSLQVPSAFQDMWARSFQPLGAVEYSDGVAVWLQDLLVAVPGLIIAEGLSEGELESQSVGFPYAESVPPLQAPKAAAEAEVVLEAVAVEPEAVLEPELHPIEDAAPEVENPVAPDTPGVVVEADATAYDADVSQSASKRTKRRHSELIPQSSSPAEVDVFGPKGSASSVRKSRVRKGRRTTRGRSESGSATPAPADTTVIAETPMDDEEDVPIYITEASPSQRHSIFTSASRWLRRVPSLVFGGSDESAHGSPPNSGNQGSPAPSKRRKRRRGDSREQSVAEVEVVDMTQPSPEPELQPAIVVSEPTPETSRSDIVVPSRRTASRTVSTRSSRASTPQPVVTRSAARKRESQPDSSSQRKSKRRRRTPRGTPVEGDEKEPTDVAAQLKRDAEEAAARVEVEAQAAEAARLAQEATEREEQERQEREQEERAKLEREAAELAERERLEAEKLETEHLEAEKAAREEKERLEREEAELQLRMQVAKEEEARQAKALEKERARKEKEDAETAAKGKPKAKATTQSSTQEPEISGVFDDAPGDVTPRGCRPARTTTPPRNADITPAPTPMHRSSTQKHVLEMLEEAARHESVIAGLDIDGVVDLMANIELLRSAAAVRLQAHAQANKEERARLRASRRRE